MDQIGNSLWRVVINCLCYHAPPVPEFVIVEHGAIGDATSALPFGALLNSRRPFGRSRASNPGPVPVPEHGSLRNRLKLNRRRGESCRGQCIEAHWIPCEAGVSVGLSPAGGSRMRPQWHIRGMAKARMANRQAENRARSSRRSMLAERAFRRDRRPRSWASLYLGEHEAPDPGAAQPEAVRRHAAALAQARQATAHRRAPVAHRQGHAGVRAAPPAAPGEKRGRQAAGHKIGFRAARRPANRDPRTGRGRARARTRSGAAGRSPAPARPSPWRR